MAARTTGRDSRRGLWRSRWAAIGAAVAVTLGGGGLVAVNAASGPASSVVTVTPERVLDTRTGVGLSGPFVSGVSRKLQITSAVVPAGATGVLLNVTVVAPSAAGFLSVRPGDATGMPSTSSLNFAAGDIVPNSVQVALPTAGANAGQIDITFDAFGVPGPTTNVLADVVGYLLAGGPGTPGSAGAPGPTGAPGAAGANGATGQRGPLTSSCSATLRWDLSACRAATVAVGAGASPEGVAFDGTNIWVANAGLGNVSKINPATNTVIATVPVGTGPEGVAFDGTNIWVTNNGPDTVSKINPGTNTRTDVPLAFGANPRAVAFDGTSIWVANAGLNTVSKIDPATNTRTDFLVDIFPFGVAFDGTNIWVIHFNPGRVTKINPVTGALIDTVLLAFPRGVAFDGTSIWVTSSGSNNVTKIDPVSGDVIATVAVGASPRGVAFDGTNIWVTNSLTNNVSKIVPF